MSSTRKAKDDSVFHQSRYASSQEFERGLLANLVAKRCALIDDAVGRELIWFIQYLSHQSGGLAAVAREILEKYSDRIQTEEMAEMNLKPGKICNAEQVRKLRDVMGGAREYPLKGEVSRDLWDELLDKNATDYVTAQKHPVHYPSNVFFESCKKAAEQNLEREFSEICLNPACKLASYRPWYFPRLIETLREYKDEFVKIKSAGGVITALGGKVWDVLDYTFHSRGLTLMEGDARTGKTFAARTWCEQQPGLARFVEVPPGNDEASFFRALARGLGLGNFLNYKVSEIRSRVESVLQSRDILLVLDEAQRLWPQRNLRYGFPNRIVWVMTMANAGVPVAMVSTPQFTLTQKAVEKTGWNSAQLIGRITHYESLPTDLSPDDLMAVARTVLPEADAQSLKAMATYARLSARYLAAIDSIAKRARFIAIREGRTEASTDDVRKAMQESVIPADSKLIRALDAGGKSKTLSVTPLPVLPMQLEAVRKSDAKILPALSRANTGVPSSRGHSEFEAPLIVA